MKTKNFLKVLGVLIAVALLLAVLPQQAKAQGGIDATTRFVCPPEQTCDYHTIQAAIDAAQDGDTISVGPGTYNENLVINKSLDLIGAGIDQTIVQAVKGRNYNGGGFQSPIVSITGNAALLNLFPINITAPEAIAGPMQGSLAAFGPLPGEPGWDSINGEVVYASDPLACSVPTNVSGKIALIDRGTCTFIAKADNAQKGGAIGVIIANTDDTLIIMGSSAGYNITIPVAMITKTSGTSLKANLPATAQFQADPYGPGGVTITGFTFHGNVPATAQSDWSNGGITGLSTQGIETDSTSPIPSRQNIHITGNKFVYAGSSVVLYNTVGFEVSGNIMERTSIEYPTFGFKPHGGMIAHVSGGLNGTIAGNVGFNPEGTISVNSSKVNVIGNTIAAPGTPLEGDISIAQYGIAAMSGANINIEDNTIRGLKAGPKTSYNYGWPGEGIWVSSGASGVAITNNTLEDNVIGVHVDDAPAVGGPVLRHNKFIGNVYSILNQKGNIGTAVNTVDAKGNYWVSPNGPSVYSVAEMGATTWAAFYDLLDNEPFPFPQFAVSDKVDFAPWCTDANCLDTTPVDVVVELSGNINIPGGIKIDVPHLTYHLAADTVIQNASPCFVINASYTQIIAEPGAKCIPTGGANGIDVAAGLVNIVVDGLEIDGTNQNTGDGIHFAGVVTDVLLKDNKIHDLDGDGVKFTESPDPTGVIDIHGNLFQNNGGVGINNANGTAPFDATYNSWGSYGGPAAGDGVSDYVDADPWTHADIAVNSIVSNTTSRVVTTLANVSGRPTVLKDGNIYHMWYGTNDSTLYHTFSTNPAEFPAGTLVTFSGGTPAEVASPAIIKETDGFKMIAYAPGTTLRFALYTSNDGNVWNKGPEVFDGTSNFLKVDAPFLLKTETGYRLYFQVKIGTGVDERYKIYAAESADIDGLYTLVNSGNPVLSPAASTAAWDGKYVMHPWVVFDGTTYYMWYSAHNGVKPQQIGLATSTDGLTWAKSAANPVIGPVGEPSVIKDGSIWRIWYLGAGSSIKYQSALSPLDLRQTLSYQVKANLVNVLSADVTLNFPASLLSIAEITPGSNFNNVAFNTSTDGSIEFIGYNLGNPAVPVTDENVVLFNVTFHTDTQGAGDLIFGPAEFGMPAAGSSANVYLAAAVDNATAQVNELPSLTTTFGDAYYLVGDAQSFDVVITNKGTAYPNAELRMNIPAGLTVIGDNPLNLGGLDQSENIPLTLTATASTSGQKTMAFDVYSGPTPTGLLLFSTVETATVYTKPTISSTDIVGPYQINVAKTIHITVSTPDVIASSYILNLSLPAGTVVTYGSNSYTCDEDGCVIPVTLSAGDNVLEFSVKFVAAGSSDVTATLKDNANETGRMLATQSWTGLTFFGNFTVTGTVSMQGRTYRGGVVMALTPPTGYPYATSFPATSIDQLSNNLLWPSIYSNSTEFGITTTQDRYLNVTSDLNARITIGTGSVTIAPLVLRGGNVVNDGASANIVDVADAGVVGGNYWATGNNPGDANFDLIVNIQDLALVGSNFLLDSAHAYANWMGAQVHNP